MTVRIDGMEEAVRAEVTVYDEERMALERREIAPGDTSLSWTETLPEGRYYIRVRRLSGEQATPYTITYFLE